MIVKTARKLSILGIIGMAMLVEGKELMSFSEIADALKGGNSIRMVIHPDHCDLGKDLPSFIYTEAHAVMVRPTYLQFANTPLTTNHPAFEKMPVLENVTYRISDTGTVHITMRLITLPDYQVKGEHSMNCILYRS